MTRKNLLREIRKELKHLPHPVKDARAIVAHVCGCTAEELLSHPDTSVTKKEARKIRRVAAKRAQGTPIAYIVGERAFYGRSFKVTKHTLIPRPETETLVDIAKSLHAPNTGYIDIGTGSGAISVTLAAETGAPVIATDVSRKALKMAKINARNQGVGDLIRFSQGNLLAALSPKWFRDWNRVVLTANLPYLTEEMYSKAPDQVFANELSVEPKGALVSDATDGLDDYRHLFTQIQEGRNAFPADLIVLIELLPLQKRPAEKAIRSIAPLAKIIGHKDLSKRYRVLEVHL